VSSATATSFLVWLCLIYSWAAIAAFTWVTGALCSIFAGIAALALPRWAAFAARCFSLF